MSDDQEEISLVATKGIMDTPIGKVNFNITEGSHAYLTTDVGSVEFPLRHRGKDYRGSFHVYAVWDKEHNRTQWTVEYPGKLHSNHAKVEFYHVSPGLRFPAQSTQDAVTKQVLEAWSNFVTLPMRAKAQQEHLDSRKEQVQKKVKEAEEALQLAKVEEAIILQQEALLISLPKPDENPKAYEMIAGVILSR